MLDKGIKVSYRHIYYDGRAGIWADPSTLFFQDAKGCFDNSEGLPRCIKFDVPIGNPMVERIEIAYEENGVWKRGDIIDKYKKYNSSQEFWYQRGLSEEVSSTLDEENCTFEYLFCNDKQCDPIAPEEFSRVYNPAPRSPQGILNIGDELGFYNYIQGNCPIDKFEVDKFQIGLNCESNDCEQKLVTIKVRAIVHNRTHGGNQFIYRMEGANNSPDDKNDRAYFGGLNNDGIGVGELETGYEQYFNGETRNFIAYVEGSEYFAEMKQWKAHAFFRNLELWNTLSNLQDNSRLRRWRRAINDNEFFYQEAEIKVPKGTRGFLRLASHQSTGNDQDKSTYVVGILNDLYEYKGRININSISDLTSEEIYFDTCNLESDTLEITKAFIVDDNAVDTGLTDKSSAYSGYISDLSGRPVENAIVAIGGIESKTDHNGFYHLYLFPGSNDQQTVNVKVEIDCFSFDTIGSFTVTGEKGAMSELDYEIESENYNDTKYTNVIMQVRDCNGAGVGGIRVAISGSKYRATGADGFARFRIRNNSTRNRQVRTVVMNGNGCIETDCAGNCFPCMPTSTSGTAVCYTGGSQTTTMPFGVINISSIVANRMGLKSGGLYPFGFVVKGSCGRQSAVNRITDLSIPKTQTKTKEGFCSLTYNATGLRLPDWADCIQIVRGANLNGFLLQWVVDDIERTDDGKIKLTIQSLNDYNARFFFKTNTIYQWLQNDRVEFIKNGDGKIFSVATNGILNYLTLSPFHDEAVSGEEDAPADFFNQLLITDDGKLDDLKKGAIIELQRDAECTTNPIYYSICASIPVNKETGLLEYPVGMFNTFDTYFVNRKIGDFPAQRFEHHSPSDFWGERVTDAGRTYFENKYENEQRFGRNITINSPNEYNRFGDLVRTIEPVIHGDIVAMWLNDGKVGLAISEHDNSLFEVGDDFLRVGGDGIVRAVTAEALISDMQPKLQGRFGCQYPHIGSIFFGDGWVTWIDVNRHTFVEHDYQLARAADEGKVQTYFRKMCQDIETFNRTAVDDLDKFRFCTGLNNHTGALSVTTKSLRHSGVNNSSGIFELPNETILYHPVAKDFPTFVSYTSEGYGEINLFDGEGCAFVSFLNGIPYIHPIIPTKYNEFFGISCDWIVGIVLNQFPEKIKVAVSMEQQSEELFFAENVFTDQPGYRSEIPAKVFKKTECKWNGFFKGNINSRKGLHGNENPRGYFVGVLLKRDNTVDLQYLTVDPAKRVKYSELDAFLIKHSISEQAGFTENL